MRALLVSLFQTLILFAVSQTSGLNNALKLLLEEKNSPGFSCDILVEGNIQKISDHQHDFNYRLNYFAGEIASIRCNFKTIPALLDNKIILRAFAANQTMALRKLHAARRVIQRHQIFALLQISETATYIFFAEAFGGCESLPQNGRRKNSAKCRSAERSNNQSLHEFYQYN